MSTGAIGPIDEALLPQSVRTGSTADKNAYSAALGFEQMLVQQLSQSLTDSTSTDGLGDDSDDATDDDSGLGSTDDTSDSPYASLLPDALAQGIMNAGGLGLAQQLAPALEGGSSSLGAPTPTTTTEAS